MGRQGAEPGPQPGETGGQGFAGWGGLTSPLLAVRFCRAPAQASRVASFLLLPMRFRYVRIASEWYSQLLPLGLASSSGRGQS